MLNQLESDVRQATSESIWHGKLLVSPPVEEDSANYLENVAHARRYIHDGDIFQANLSRLWQVELHPQTPTAEIYRRLRRANPAPFAGLALHGDYAIISSSPERLVSVRGARVETRPIAGTRPRGADTACDASYKGAD